jgi:hypothetical protein
MKRKYQLASFLILSTVSMNCFSQNFSSANPSAPREGAPDFGRSKSEMINFHKVKVIDHQKVVDCLKVSIDFESMNACNKHLEKYIKKDNQKENEEEDK